MREPSLVELQRWMKARVLEQAASHTPTAAPVLNRQRSAPGLARLAIYAGGYRTRIREALAEVYEAVQHIVGARAFTELAAGYAQQYPSHDYNLSFVGRHLPQFLKTHPRTQRLPFLPDVARLEWAVCEAFHAFDQPPIDTTALSSLSLDAWARARLAFQPSVHLVASPWPIRDLWQVRTQPRRAINVDLVNRPQRVLVCRQALQVRCELLTAREHEVLTALLDGHPLGQVCGALTVSSQGEAPVADWFARWGRLELIRAVQTDG